MNQSAHELFRRIVAGEITAGTPEGAPAVGNDARWSRPTFWPTSDSLEVAISGVTKAAATDEADFTVWARQRLRDGTTVAIPLRVLTIAAGQFQVPATQIRAVPWADYAVTITRLPGGAAPHNITGAVITYRFYQAIAVTGI